MNQLVRTTLNLEQYQCRQCGRLAAKERQGF